MIKNDRAVYDEEDHDGPARSVRCLDCGQVSTEATVSPTGRTLGSSFRQ